MIKKKSCILFFLLLATIFMIGCKSGNVTALLEQIDSLLVHDKVDSAQIMLGNIPMETIHYKKDSAYYYLLLTETEYRKWIPTKSDSAINFCITHYEKNPDNEKLARAYYYKGVTFSPHIGIPQTIILLKRAEEYANKTDNRLVKHKIYETLSYYNNLAYEYDLSLH